MSVFAQFHESVREDFDAARRVRERYPTDGPSMRPRRLLVAAVTQVGFQMLIGVRLMRLARDARIPGGAQVISRLLRHLYGAEIHWNAEIAPGVCIVHGNGLVISHGSKIGPNCVLFQNVTLGESMGGGSRKVGSPTLEADVHVMPGAIVLGPIVIGSGTKIGANAVVDDDVAPGSVVRSPSPEVSARRSAGSS